jgi:hypothetical protein
VPAFDPDEQSQWNQVDWALLQNGFVTKFCSTDMLEKSVTWLRQSGYEIVEMDTADWESESDIHLAFSEGFSFPEYYGDNFNALRDCLRDVAHYAYGSNRDATGTVLVMKNFDRFLRKDRDLSQALLEVFAYGAHFALLIGHRMICLIQCSDPDTAIDPIGAISVQWDREEFLNSVRRPLADWPAGD